MADKKGFFQEFREFATKGNVVDLAVGVIVGGAFGTITKSLTDDVIMPVVSLFLGGINFSEWKIVLKEAVLNPDGTEAAAAVSLNYGNFISTIINFLILAFVIFCMVRFLNRARSAAEARRAAAQAAPEPAPEPEPAPPAPTAEELLADILTELKSRK
ncbi:MAG: large-conductance mechanosensitive channel protein MscL [Candidatus Heteroscillospira sp.]|jgi:large conductance mechanosensitive channel